MPKATTAVDQAGRQQRHAEEEVKPDGGADELRQVGGHGDQPRPAPTGPGETGTREVVAAELRQVAARRDASLSPTGTARASPSGWRATIAQPSAYPETSRQPRSSSRSCRDRCRPRRRRTPGRATPNTAIPGREPAASATRLGGASPVGCRRPPAGAAESAVTGRPQPIDGPSPERLRCARVG